MTIYPTKTAAHLAVAGVVVFVVGIALREAMIVGWGGAVVVAIVAARTATLLSVMRIRSAGFEMLWVGSARLSQCHPGSVVTLLAEVRNRDTLSARFDHLRVVCSPALHTWVEPAAGRVPAGGAVRLKIHVKALRVGHHGIYGLALEVRGGPGLFEVPLTFANPYGLEVLPRALGRALSTARGGRSRSFALAGCSGRARGDGTDLHELREHSPGDAFRRIAWKASAKRGVLVVREFEREERDVIMLVLDASVELWAGAVGRAPLDRAIEIVASLATDYLARGDRVGLVVIGARELGRVPPDAGRKQARHIAATLIASTAVIDVDRCSWDAADLAVQVTEHLRPLDPKAVSDLRNNRIERLARRAAAFLPHAPFTPLAPRGSSEHDQGLRRYAAAFGIHVPPRLEPDRKQAVVAMTGLLMQLAGPGRRKRGESLSLIHVVAPTPHEGEAPQLAPALKRLRGRGVALRWTPTPVAISRDASPLPLEHAESGPWDWSEEPLSEVQALVERAVVLRAALTSRRGEARLRRLGVTVVRDAYRQHSSSLGASTIASPADYKTPAPGRPTQGEEALA